MTKSDYEFSQKEAGDYSNQFTLVFSSNSLTTLNTGDIENTNSISLMKLSNGYQVNSSKMMRTVRFYDMLGRMLYEIEPHKREFHISTERLRLGTILLVELLMEDGSRVVRKTINY